MYWIEPLDQAKVLIGVMAGRQQWGKPVVVLVLLYRYHTANATGEEARAQTSNGVVLGTVLPNVHEFLGMKFAKWQ